MAYTITFKNIKEQTCVVTIDCTATGTLTPAAVPFETQEDAPDSIFDTIVGQSGYIRVIDCGENVLQNLIPSSVKSYAVTLTVAGVVKWRGFVAPDAYQQEWGAPTAQVPTEIEIPIISPLAALQYITYPGETYGVNNTMVGNILINALTKVYDSSTPLMYPYIGNDDFWNGLKFCAGLQTYIYNHNFAEFNEEDNRWEYQTCAEVIDTISKFYGWQWREWEGGLVLTESDVETQDITYNRVGTIAGLNNPTTISQSDKCEETLTDVAVWDGVGHNMSVIQGKKDIEITSKINVGEEAIVIPDFRKTLKCFKKVGTYESLSGGEPDTGTFGDGSENENACYIGWYGNDYIKLYQYDKSGSLIHNTIELVDTNQGCGCLFRQQLLKEISGESYYKIIGGGSISTIAYFDKTNLTTSSMGDVIHLSSYGNGEQNTYRPAIELKSRYTICNQKTAYLKISGNIQRFSNNLHTMTLEGIEEEFFRMKIYARYFVGSQEQRVYIGGGSTGYYWTDTETHCTCKIRDSKFSLYTLPVVDAFNGFNLADGFYKQMKTNEGALVSGDLSVILYTPNDAEEIYQITNLAIDVLQREDTQYTNKVIDDESYTYKDRVTSTDNLFLDDYSASIQMATDRGRGNGRAVVRKSTGEPLLKEEVISSSQNNEYIEEMLLRRYCDWFRQNRRKLEVEVEYDSRFNPMARLDQDSKVYMPFGHSIDWKGCKDIMTLIELRTL